MEGRDGILINCKPIIKKNGIQKGAIFFLFIFIKKKKLR